jgi:hypothetical protein
MILKVASRDGLNHHEAFRFRFRAGPTGACYDSRNEEASKGLVSAAGEPVAACKCDASVMVIAGNQDTVVPLGSRVVVVADLSDQE